MLFVLCLISLKSKCCVRRSLFLYFFYNKQFLEATSIYKKENWEWELQTSSFDTDQAFSHRLTFQKHLKRFCATSSGECYTVLDLRSCHKWTWWPVVVRPAWLVCSEHTTGTPCRLFSFHSCFSPSNFCSSHRYLSSPGLFYCLAFKDISSWQPCGNYLAEQPSQQWHFRRKFVSFLLVNSDFWSHEWSTFIRNWNFNVRALACLAQVQCGSHTNLQEIQAPSLALPGDLHVSS